MPVGFLLKRVQHVDRLLKAHRIDGSIRIALVRLDDLHHARTQPLPRFRRRGYASELRDAKGIPDVVLYPLRELEQIPLGRSDPVQRLLAHSQDAAHTRIIPFLG